MPSKDSECGVPSTQTVEITSRQTPRRRVKARIFESGHDGCIAPSGAWYRCIFVKSSREPSATRICAGLQRARPDPALLDIPAGSINVPTAASFLPDLRVRPQQFSSLAMSICIGLVYAVQGRGVQIPMKPAGYSDLKPTAVPI